MLRKNNRPKRDFIFIYVYIYYAMRYDLCLITQKCQRSVLLESLAQSQIRENERKWSEVFVDEEALRLWSRRREEPL